MEKKNKDFLALLSASLSIALFVTGIYLKNVVFIVSSIILFILFVFFNTKNIEDSKPK